MREIISGLTTCIVTVFIHEWAMVRFGFEYNMFKDEFNLLLVSLDFGIWLGIFIPIYFVAKKIFVKKKKTSYSPNK